MRTTVNIDDQLLREAKAAAVDTGRTLTNVFEDALRESFARRRQAHPKRKVRLTTFKGDGVRPGVDLHNSAALLEIMDRGGNAAP
jgi:Arc/MetJ family transcription regulator